jgi:hypothetical protein
MDIVAPREESSGAWGRIRASSCLTRSENARAAGKGLDVVETPKIEISEHKLADDTHRRMVCEHYTE